MDEEDADRLFQQSVCDALESSKTTDADFAEKIGVSVNTIRRWKSGKAVPHPAVRPAILDTLSKLCGTNE